MPARLRLLVPLVAAALVLPGLVALPSAAALLPAADVTLAVDVARITVGNAPTLSGSVTDVAGAPAGGVDVVIQAKPYGASSYTPLTTLTTDGAGRFATPIRPDRQTAYVAQADAVRSPGVVVFVAQRMTITSPTAGATIRATMPFFGGMQPAYNGVAVGVATYDGGRFVVLGQTRTDVGRFVAAAGLPGGTHTVVVFTSARNGLLKGSRSLRVSVVPQLDAARSAVFSDQIRTAVNVERTRRGLRPLAAQPCLYDLAGEWAVHMAATNRMAHRSDSDLGARLTRCAAGATYGGGGENVAMGYPDGRSAMVGWMNSPGHRANILSTAYTHIGIGVARAADGRFYYAQNFLTLR